MAEPFFTVLAVSVFGVSPFCGQRGAELIGGA
jgi:hypothetical protein